MATAAAALAQRFGLAQHGTTLRTEVRAGVTTFMVMAYYAALKLCTGRGAQVHWMMYVASAAFVVYFGLPLIERALK